MPTTSRNTIVRQVAPSATIADLTNFVSSACTWNQGDILYFDTGTNLVKAVTADADGATVLGVAVQAVVSGKPKPVYSGTAVDAATAIEALAGPLHGVEIKVKLKNGDVFTPGAAVYATAVDAQTVSSAGVNAIGFYVGATVTAGASTEGVIRIGSAILAGTVQL